MTLLMFTLQEAQYRNKLYLENQPLKYGLTHLELEFIDIIYTMGYFINNISDQKLIIPTRQ